MIWNKHNDEDITPLKSINSPRTTIGEEEVGVTVSAAFTLSPVLTNWAVRRAAVPTAKLFNRFLVPCWAVKGVEDVTDGWQESEDILRWTLFDKKYPLTRPQ